MARIVLTTIGTLGDLHPYLAPVRPDFTEFGDLAEVMRRAMDPRQGSEYVVKHMVLPTCVRPTKICWSHAAGRRCSWGTCSRCGADRGTEARAPAHPCCARLGVARVLRRGAAGTREMARELGAIIRDPALRERAAHIGVQVSAERGAHAAGDAIEAVLDRMKRSLPNRC